MGRQAEGMRDCGRWPVRYLVAIWCSSRTFFSHSSEIGDSSYSEFNSFKILLSSSLSTPECALSVPLLGINTGTRNSEEHDGAKCRRDAQKNEKV